MLFSIRRCLSGACSLIILFSFALAAPSPIQTRDIDQTTFGNLQLFSQFCAAAYCPSNNNNGKQAVKISCTTGNCPLVENDKVTSLLQFQNSFFTDVTGFVAIDNTKKFIVLAFRGSKSWQNWVTDFDIALTDTDICASCKATQGFYGSWLEARGQILPVIQAAAAANPTYRLVVAGHSLGGAIATIAAAELRNRAYSATGKVDLYTYGAPRTGTQGLIDYINTQSTSKSQGSQFRVTHNDDPVPRLPPYSFGFRHPDPEYFINTGNGVVVTASVIKVINVATQGNHAGGDDEGFNGIDADAHGDYFGPIGACGAGADRM